MSETVRIPKNEWLATMERNEALEKENLRTVAADHLRSVLSGASTFEEIDRIKTTCLRYGIKQ